MGRGDVSAKDRGASLIMGQFVGTMPSAAPAEKRQRIDQRSDLEKKFLPIGLAFSTCSMVAFVLVVAHFLFHDVNDKIASSFKTVAASFGSAAIFFCLASHFVDPGTPQPDPPDLAPIDEADDASRIREQYLPDGRMWKQKWCRDCKLWRPHRCGHCWICGHCVLRLDHHCGFMGNCVGERNFRFFVGFLISAGMGIVSLVVLGVYCLSELGCWTDSAVWMKSWQPIAIVIFFCCCPPFPCFGLCLSTIGPALTGGGLMFTGVMLADTDLKSDEGWKHRKMTWDGARQECKSLLCCHGARAYCCGPLSCKILSLFRSVGGGSSSSSASSSSDTSSLSSFLPVDYVEMEQRA